MRFVPIFRCSLSFWLFSSFNLNICGHVFKFFYPIFIFSFSFSILVWMRCSVDKGSGEYPPHFWETFWAPNCFKKYSHYSKSFILNIPRYPFQRSIWTSIFDFHRMMLKERSLLSSEKANKVLTMLYRLTVVVQLCILGAFNHVLSLKLLVID